MPLPLSDIARSEANPVRERVENMVRQEPRTPQCCGAVTHGWVLVRAAELPRWVTQEGTRSHEFGNTEGTKPFESCFALFLERFTQRFPVHTEPEHH